MTKAVGRDWFQRELHRGNPGDEDFYARVTRGAETCLEIGAGLGRVARVVAPGMRRYVALDHDAELLAWTNSRDWPSVEALVGDMRTFEIDGVFDRILLPYNVLFCAGGLEGARATLARAHQHLTPEGEIWLDVYRLEDFHLGLTTGELPRDDGLAELVHETTLGGLEVCVFERTIADPDRQLLEVRYEARSGARLLGSEIQHHAYLLTEQLLTVAREVGLDVLGLFGDFSGAPLDEDSELLVLGLGRD